MMIKHFPLMELFFLSQLRTTSKVTSRIERDTYVILPNVAAKEEGENVKGHDPVLGFRHVHFAEPQGSCWWNEEARIICFPWIEVEK